MDCVLVDGDGLGQRDREVVAGVEAQIEAVVALILQ
jgi:flagellar biosynthesis GTPase FlhF